MDTLDHIFGTMGNWSAGTADEIDDLMLGNRDRSLDQGLPARSTGSSRLGSDFVATSPSRGDGSSRRNFWARRPWISPR